jgi:phosphoribosylanthranilate isomerase
MVTAVKICGITRVEDGLAAAHAGAHAVGLVFYSASPRCIGIPRAREVVERLPPFVTAVGLFVDPQPYDVLRVLREVPLSLLQFHGDEAPELCARFGVPYIKGCGMAAGTDLLQYAAVYRSAKALLLDTFVEGARGGGTGRSFDWGLIPRDLPLPVVLAGGLTPANVGEAIRTVRPWAVDVSSGVEREKGIKDAAKIAAFMRGVRDADV